MKSMRKKWRTSFVVKSGCPDDAIISKVFCAWPLMTFQCASLSTIRAIYSFFSCRESTIKSDLTSVTEQLSTMTMHLINTSAVSSPDKPSNKNYREDVEKTLQYTRWLLKSLGAWPMVTKNSSKPAKYFSKFFILLWIFVLSYLLLPATFNVMREKDFSARITLLGPIGFWITNSLKYGLIIYHCGTIKLCIEHLNTDWINYGDEMDREIMARNGKVGRDLTVICAVFMYAGGFSYHTFMPLWTGNKINEQNETVRPFIFPNVDVFIESPSGVTYELLFWITRVVTLVAYNAPITACNLAAVFVTHACGQVQIVIARLGTLVDGIDDSGNSNKVIQEKISTIIKCHVRVIRFSSGVERVLQDICLVEVVASTLVMCLLEYYCMTEWSHSETVSIITYFMLLVSLSFNMFIFCHIGELLKEQYHQVGKAAYMIDWYRLPGKSGLALVMIIAMADHSRKLTASGMMEMSVCSFGAIMKTSFVYLNMLRTMAE